MFDATVKEKDKGEKCHADTYIMLTITPSPAVMSMGLA